MLAYEALGPSLRVARGRKTGQRMTRKKRDTGKKRASILDAAAAEFVRVGYDRASMDEIAVLAAASKRTVYNHFGSKAVLFREVLDRFMAQSHALKKIPYDSHRSLRTQLDEFAAAMLEPTRNPIWLGLMKVIASDPTLVGIALAHTEAQADTLAAWLQAAHDDGRLQVAQPAFAAAALWAMFSGAFLMPAIFAAPLPEAHAVAMRDELVAMFLARHAPPS